METKLQKNEFKENQLEKNQLIEINIQGDKSQKEKIFRNILIAGKDDKRFDITISKGRFYSITETQGIHQQSSPLEDLWISPGLIDLHTHLAWTDFDFDDQLKRDKHEIEVMQSSAFEATLKTGITTVRDAGGLLPSEALYISSHYHHPLRVLASGDMLGSKDAQGSIYLKRKVKEIESTGTKWLKIFATGGLGAPSDKVLEPLFSKQEFFSIVHSAHARNIKIMVHTWGGITLDWAIEAGVDTVEHGVYLTENQSHALAEAGIPYIPTTAIYQIAADKNGVLSLGSELCNRAARAAEAHRKAITNATKAGVKIAFGTDFATPALHGNNLEEIYSLMDCGLTRKEAWRSATESAAEILGYGGELGNIKAGFTSDAIIFKADPYKTANAKELKESIVSVITGIIE